MTATTRTLHLPAGSTATGAHTVHVTPESAGWGHSGLRVLELSAGDTHGLDTGPGEVLVVPLSGSLPVRGEGGTLTLSGRTGVFAGPTDFAYLPMASTAELASDGGGRPRSPRPTPPGARGRGSSGPTRPRGRRSGGRRGRADRGRGRAPRNEGWRPRPGRRAPAR